MGGSSVGRGFPAWAVVAVSLAAGIGCGAERAPARAPDARPATWAVPLVEPGLPNLHRVDDGLYRGAQPSAEGMRSLERMGVRTVINLRAAHSDRDELRGTRLGYEHIRFEPWHPEDEEVEAFLRIATDPARRPGFVHCAHGADRTGMMVAIYRMVVQGWDAGEAIAEMTGGGFGFHPAWGNLVDYLRSFDAARWRRVFGLSGP
ncbi:MAG: dual specificity protein phosphatase family protein [Myxococcales bacterium]|nr:dual specificity protein phosphatase family protein [Myxococcales bacterium]